MRVHLGEFELLLLLALLQAKDEVYGVQIRAVIKSARDLPFSPAPSTPRSIGSSAAISCPHDLAIRRSSAGASASAITASNRLVRHCCGSRSERSPGWHVVSARSLRPCEREAAALCRAADACAAPTCTAGSDRRQTTPARHCTRGTIRRFMPTSRVAWWITVTLLTRLSQSTPQSVYIGAS